MNKKIKYFALILVFMVSGCVTSQDRFISSVKSLSNTDICQNYLAEKDRDSDKAPESGPQREKYLAIMQEEMKIRGLNQKTCAKLKSKNNQKIATAVVGVAVVGAIVNEIKKDKEKCKKDYRKCKSGGGGHTRPDSFWWDYWYDDHGNLVRRCRNANNGQWAESVRCLGKPNNDDRWPNK